MSFRIGNVIIKNPSSFKIERYNVTTMTRLSDASMTGDLIAQKHKFYFTYEAISADDFDVILNAIWHTDSLFFNLTYPYQGHERVCTVYVGSIPSELHRANKDNRNWVWKNVTFNLIER
jgi:hypothetical protein